MSFQTSRVIGGLVGAALAASLACGGSPDGSTPNAGKTAQPEPKKPAEAKPEAAVKPEPEPEAPPPT